MYLPTIGLEIHTELRTRSKMFCRCPNNPQERHPNLNVCPICLGHPGTLPSINKEAVILVIKLGLALGGKIASNSHFDRKSYFYPDLPKGYQISQYQQPLVEGGLVRGIRLKRIHLEEDTARLVHGQGTENYSLVDFNRAGVPLMELVTQPDIKDANHALAFAKELQLILRYLEISEADMEKGQMRIEANISLQCKSEILNSKSETNPKSKIQNSKLGTKVEIKNLNSFRAVEEAIKYEIKRQTEILEKGEKIRQETRGWDDIKKKTISQRSKESAHDYRYFPEPDLPPIRIENGRISSVFENRLLIDEINIDEIKNKIPELPEEKRRRFIQEFSLDKSAVEILVEDKAIADYFEEAASELKTYNLKFTNYNLLFNYFTSDLRGLITEKGISIKEININPKHFAYLIVLIEKGELSSRLAKNLLKKMLETGEDPETLIKNEGLKIINNESELEKIVKEIIEKNFKAVEDYKRGKTNTLQFLVGQAMMHTKGQANPEVLSRLFKKFIN